MNHPTEEDTLVHEMEKRVERLDQEFEELIRKSAAAEADARQQIESMRNDFEAKRDELQRQIGEARLAGEGAREELSKGLKQAWNDVSDAFNRARSELMKAT